MTSFVRRLAKSLSHDSGAGGPRDPRCPEPLSTKHSSPRQLSASPSFNDFSLRAEEDGERIRDATRSAQCRSRAAVEEFGRAFWTKTPTATTMHRPTASSSGNATSFFDDGGLSRLLGGSTPTESPVGSPTESTSSMMSALPKKTTRKIVGLDPYDFCDLLKSSSL